MIKVTDEEFNKKVKEVEDALFLIGTDILRPVEAKNEGCRWYVPSRNRLHDCK